jgi:hypothetical protein
MSEPDTTKDIVFEEPRVPNRYAREDSEDKTQPRGYWTVAEVEEVMWRIRASGGTDSTPIKFGGTTGRKYRGGTPIRAEGVEAFPIEVPRRRVVACKACDDERVLTGTKGPTPCPVCAPREPLLPRLPRLAAQAVGVLLAAPLLLAALVYAWSFLWGAVR